VSEWAERAPTPRPERDIRLKLVPYLKGVLPKWESVQSGRRNAIGAGSIAAAAPLAKAVATGSGTTLYSLAPPNCARCGNRGQSGLHPVSETEN
jgi:hypothetical protein